MADDIQITNCHIHTFTQRHIPSRYPTPLVAWLKNIPGFVPALAWVLRLIGHPAAETLERLYRFQQESTKPRQADILAQVQRHYPENTRYVILPMDMAGIGYGEVAASLREQHDELAEMARTDGLAGKVLPFATIFPGNDPGGTEALRAIRDLGFRGLKIYPRLGFAPDHPVLMDVLYPELVARNLPVMTHCSRGGVRGRDVSNHAGDRVSDPFAYRPVLDRFDGLRICLAHFGGQADWKAYVDDGGIVVPGSSAEDNWQTRIRRMIGSGEFRGLWTDISYTLFRFDDYIPFLRLFLTGEDEASARLRARVLFGSDFYMTRQERLSERAVCFRLRNALGEEIFRQIADRNPRVWLGEAADDDWIAP